MQYDINVTRDGRWWMIEVPAIDGLTQARRISEVEEQARSLISVTLDVAPSAIELGNIEITAEGAGAVSGRVAEIAHQKAIAADAEATASKLTKEAVIDLVKAEVPVRDIGTLLNISYQRVSQIAAV